MRIQVGGSPLYDLQRLGQSVWLDCNHPCVLAGSRLGRLIRDGIAGVDWSSVDFATAYAEDPAHHEAIAELRSVGATARQVYERFAIDDTRRAADRLRRTYDHTGGRDGYACVELSPTLAHDVEGTESQARRLWRRIGKPNIMIKIPATDAGLLAIRRLIAAGINVNSTLIFGAHRYREVADAYLSGLEDRLRERLPIDHVASLASVWVSRLDNAVNKELDSIGASAGVARAKPLRDRTAVAVAQFIYQRYKTVVASARWRSLGAHHGQTQRLLWASTDINDRDCGGLRYVNALVGRDTVNLMSLNTLSAYLDHGAPAPTLERNLHEVLDLFGELEALRVDLDQVSTQLQRACLDAFAGIGHSRPILRMPDSTQGSRAIAHSENQLLR